jgi:pyruvate dehydrogenase E2 component (dihydrolipoamide acetyltransferase)
VSRSGLPNAAEGNGGRCAVTDTETKEKDGRIDTDNSHWKHPRSNNPMATEVKLPPLGEDAPDEAEVSFWYVDEGDQIAEGDDMVEMVTDKAAFTVPAPFSGTVESIAVQEGDKADVGQVIATVQE